MQSLSEGANPAGPSKTAVRPPKETVPFDVLWCVFSYGEDASWFKPGYGDVIGVPIEQFATGIDA